MCFYCTHNAFLGSLGCNSMIGIDSVALNVETKANNKNLITYLPAELIVQIR